MGIGMSLGLIMGRSQTAQLTLGSMSLGLQALPSIAWLPLALHSLAFMVGWVLAPVILLHVAILMAWVTFLLTASGLYFSSRFKKTTTAVVMNLALGLTLWGLIPLGASILSGVIGLVALWAVNAPHQLSALTCAYLVNAVIFMSSQIRYDPG
jgi:hypothetical protein